MNSTLKISLVVNIRNAVTHLDSRLDSRKGADEIVVVDMESSDRTAKIARSHGTCVFTIPPAGYVEPARNFAFSRATGDWILVLDADEHVRDGRAAFLARILSLPVLHGGLACLEQSKGVVTTHHMAAHLRDWLEKQNRYTDFEPASPDKKDWPGVLEEMHAEFVTAYTPALDGSLSLVLAFPHANYRLLIYAKQWECTGAFPGPLAASAAASLVLGKTRTAPSQLFVPGLAGIGVGASRLPPVDHESGWLATDADPMWLLPALEIPQAHSWKWPPNSRCIRSQRKRRNIFLKKVARRASPPPAGFRV